MDADSVADSDNELVIEDDEFEQPGTLRRGKSFRQYLDDPHEEIVLTQTETEDSDNDASQPSTARHLKKADSLEEFENLERQAGAEQDSQLGRVGVAETPTSYLRTLRDAQQASNTAQSARPNASASVPASSQSYVPTPGAQRPPSTSLLRKQELIEELQLESEIQQLTEPHRVPGAADRATQSGAASKTPGATNRDTRTPFAHSASAIAAALRDSVHDELMMEAAAQLDDDQDEPAPFVNTDDGLAMPSDEQLEQFDEESDSPAPQEVSEVVGDAAQFDADGNVLQFDADANVLQFDADGNVLQFDADGNVLQFDADGNVLQFDADGNVLQFDADGNMLQFDADGNPVQFDSDGNVVQLDAEGNPVQPEGEEPAGYINEDGYYVAPDGNVYEVQKGEDGQLYYGELVGTVNGEEVYVGPEGDQQPEIPAVPEEDEDAEHAEQDADAQQRVDPIELHDKLQHVIEEYYQSGRLERIGSEELVTRTDSSPFVNTHATLVEEHEPPAASNQSDEPTSKRAKPQQETPQKRNSVAAAQPTRTRPRADSSDESSDDADARNKDEQQALFRTLQNDYNRLLTKYALAEVTIDQLRLGAHVKLDYSVTQPPAPPTQPLLRQLRIDPARLPPTDPRRAGATSAHAELMLASLNAELDVLSSDGAPSQDPSRNVPEEKRAYSALDPRLLSQYAELFGLAHLAQPAAEQFAQLHDGDERFYTAPNQPPPSNALTQVQVAALLARTPTQFASEFDESVEAPSHLPPGAQRAPSRGYQPMRPATSTQNVADPNSLLAARRPSGYDQTQLGDAQDQDILMDTEVPLLASKRRTVSMDAAAGWPHPHSASVRPSNADHAAFHDPQQPAFFGGSRPSLGSAAGPLLPSLLSAVTSVPSNMQNLQTFNALDPTRHVSTTSSTAPESTSRNAQLQQRIVEQETSKLQLAQLAERLQNDIDQLQTGLDAEQIDVDVQEELCASIKQQYDELQERYKQLRDVDSELRKQQVLLEVVLPSAEAEKVTQTSFVNLATGRSANGATGSSAAVNSEVKLEEALFNISLKLDDVNQRVDTNVKRANRRVPFQVTHNTNVLASGGQKLSNLGSVGALPSLFNARKSSTPGAVRRPPSQTGSILLDASGMLLDEASQFDPELNQKLAQLEDEYVALMNHYTVIKQMPRTPQRDGEIESLMRRLEDIANEAKASPVPLAEMGSVNTLAQMQAAGSAATLPAMPRSNVGGSLTSLPNGETPHGSGYDLRGNEPPSRPLTTTALERDGESETPLFNSTMIGVSAPNLSNLARAVPSSPSTRGQQASRIPRRGSQGTPVQQLRSELDALVERPATLESNAQLNTLLQPASHGPSPHSQPSQADFPAESNVRHASNARLQAARRGSPLSANPHMSSTTNRSHSAGVLMHGHKTDSLLPESDAGSDIFRAAQELLLDTDTLNSARSDNDPYADSDTRTSQANGLQPSDWPHQNPDYSYQYSYDQSEILDEPPYAHFAQFDNDPRQAPQQNRANLLRPAVAKSLTSQFQRPTNPDADADNEFDMELENIDLGTEDQEQLRMIEQEIQSAREPAFGAGPHAAYGQGPFDKQRHLHSANQIYTDESGFIGSESANSAMTASLLSAPAAAAHSGQSRAGAASRGNQPLAQPAGSVTAAGQTPPATRGQSTPSGRRPNDAGASHTVTAQPNMEPALRPSEQFPASTQSQRRTPMNAPVRPDPNAGRRTVATPSGLQAASGGPQNTVASAAHQSSKVNERVQAAGTPSTRAGAEAASLAGRAQGMAPRARQSPLASGAPTPTLSDARGANAPPTGTSRPVKAQTAGTSREGNAPSGGSYRDGNAPSAGISRSGNVPSAGTSRDGNAPSAGISRSGNAPSVGTSRDGNAPSAGTSRAGNAPQAGVTSSSSARQPAKASKSNQPAAGTSSAANRPFVLDGSVHARDDDSYSDSYSSTVTSSSRSVSTDSLTVSEPELAANSRPRTTVSADRQMTSDRHQKSNDRSASKGLSDMVRQQPRSATHPDVSAVPRTNELRQPLASRQPPTLDAREPQRDRNSADRTKAAPDKGHSPATSGAVRGHAAHSLQAHDAPQRRASPDDAPPPVPPRTNRRDSQPLQNSNSRERTARLASSRPDETASKTAPPRGGPPLKATLPLASALADQNAWARHGSGSVPGLDDPALRRSSTRSFASAASPCPTCGSLRHSPDVSLAHRHGAHSRLPQDERLSDSFSDSGSDVSRSAPEHARYRRDNDNDRLGHSSRPERGRSRNLKDRSLEAHLEHSSASPKRSGSTARSPKRDQRSDAHKRTHSISRNTRSSSAFEPDDDARRFDHPNNQDALATSARRYPDGQSALGSSRHLEQRPNGLDSIVTSSSRFERYPKGHDARESPARRFDHHSNSQDALATPSRLLERLAGDHEGLGTPARRFGQHPNTQDVLSASARRFERHLDSQESLGSSSRPFDRHPDSQDSLRTSARRFDRRPDSQESLRATSNLYERHPDGQDAHGSSGSLGSSVRHSSRRSEERSDEEADPSMLRAADASSKRRQRLHGSPTAGRQASFAPGDSARRDGSPRRPRSRRDDAQGGESRSPSRSPDGRSRVREYLPTGDNVRYLVREYEYGDEERQARGQALDGPEAWATPSPRRRSRSRRGEYSPERHTSGARARSAGRRHGERPEEAHSKTHGRDNLDRLLAALDKAWRNADSVNMLTVKMKRNLQLDVDRASNCSTPLHKNTRFV